MKKLKAIGLCFKAAIAITVIVCTAWSTPVGGADSSTGSYALVKE